MVSKGTSHRGTPSKPAPKTRAIKVNARKRPDSSAREPAHTSGIFPVVGVGASAGGLEAFSQLLMHLPGISNLSLVLVQHLDPTYKSLLTELLQKTTRMPVEEVSDGMRVERGHVYVIPPNTSMTISNGVLHLTPREEGALRHSPIDAFLRSLAEDEGSRAIGVILSGTSLDGILGLRAIKEAGGITIAEDEESAKYSDLPRSAVRAGVIDFVLPPDGIAKELLRLSEHPFAPHLDEKKTDQLLPQDHLHRIFELLKESTGVDFSDYKHTTIKRRIIRRMTVLRIDKLDKYLNYLASNPMEVEALFQEILIHVTGFFREPDTFQTLRAEVFPLLLKARAVDDPFRIWIPGCSTGEEAYSVAMSLAETLDTSPVKPPIQIFATDVNETVLRKARDGIYTDISEVAAGRQRRFFVKLDGNFQVAKAIRNMVIFAKQNVVTDPPFSRMDLIFCRNLMIYLGPVLQRKLVPILHYALKPSGFLVLGSFETIGGFSSMFQPIDKKHKIYGKRTTPTPSLVNVFPVRLHEYETRLDAGPGRHNAGPIASVTELDVIKEADRLLLSKYAPASVIVNSDLEIVQFRGRTGRFLEPSPGKASLNVLKMAREGMMVYLKDAIRRAKEKNAPVGREDIWVRTNGKYILASVEVTPLKSAGCYLIAFSEVEQRRASAEKESKEPSVSQRKSGGKDARIMEDQVAQLQSELGATKDYLQSIIEEKEASNEELKAANEEIQSSNEELQSTNEELETAKEELQSTNEELTTVNEELQNRNTQLGTLIDDYNNVLNSITLPIVILGSDLRIRRTTPAAEKLLNLLPSDLGRNFTEIRLNMKIPEVDRLIGSVIDQVAAREVEVQDERGRWFQVWVRPYRTSENKIDGAVISFNDITPFKKSEEQLRSYYANLEGMVKEKTAQLGDAQRLAAIGETAAMIGHDMRNPLQAMLNLLHLANDRAKGLNDRELQELVGTLRDQAGYMDRIVRDLQDYARPMVPRMAEVNVRKLLADTLSSLTIPENVKVNLEVEEGTGSIMVDPDLMRRALTNVVWNALQAVQEDGGSVHLKASRNDSTIQIAVHDEGKGISVEDQERVFSPLYTTKAKGMGLGLPVSKRIVEAHNGSIKLSSQLGRGTTFTVELPMKGLSQTS